MILGLSILLVLSMVALGAVWLSYRYQWRPVGVPRWPAPAPGQQRGHDFEEELRPYRTGEYPVVEAAAEPVEAEQVGPYRSRHAADEDLAETTARPWQVPALENEATPFFWSTGELPVYDTEELSATNSWNRAELLARLGMDEEAAA